jgi:P-type Cu+ transporter
MHRELNVTAQGPLEGAIDPVCGMTVEPEQARSRGLHSTYRDVDYFFCSRGCKLDFEEDPGKYLDPPHQP